MRSRGGGVSLITDEGWRESDPLGPFPVCVKLEGKWEKAKKEGEIFLFLKREKESEFIIRDLNGQEKVGEWIWKRRLTL